MKGGWKIWHSEECHNFHFYSNTIKTIKSRREGEIVEHVTRMGGDYKYP